MKNRLYQALAAYAALGGAAAYLLTGLARYAVLILFAGLALKTLIAYKAGWVHPSSLDSRSETPNPDKGSETESPPQ